MGHDLMGLALRQDTRATSVLLAAPRKRALRAMLYLSSTRVPAVIQKLIEWLSDPDGNVRAEAESRLIEWADTSFLHRWGGYDW